MRGKRINKSHPSYAEYIEKCKLLFEEYIELTEAEEAKYKSWHPGSGFDHPASVAVRELERDRNEKLGVLQKEYADIWK